MAYQDRNAQINKSLETLIDYLIRSGLMKQQFGQSKTLEEQQQAGQMQYLGEQQRGSSALEKFRQEGRLDEIIKGSIANKEEENLKHKNMSERAMNEWILKISQLPEFDMMTADMQEKYLRGEDVSAYRQKIEDMVASHSIGIANDLFSGKVTPEVLSGLRKIDRTAANTLYGKLLENFMQTQKMEKVDIPGLGLRGREVAVSEAGIPLREREVALKEAGVSEPGKLTDVDKQWIEQLDKAQAFIVSQEEKAAQLSPESYGLILQNLGRIRNKILNHQPLESREQFFINKIRNTAGLSKPGQMSMLLEPLLTQPTATETAPIPAPAATTAQVAPVAKAYKYTATNPTTGQVAGSNDGITWYDIRTGQVIK